MSNGDNGKEQMANNPSRDDVHEQRSPAQPLEGVVPEKDTTEPAVRPPTPTQGDQERADWEGMAQPAKK